MTNLKKAIAIGTTAIVLGATPLTAFAAQVRPILPPVQTPPPTVRTAPAYNYNNQAGVALRDGSCYTTGVRQGTGRGAGGTGQLLGIGGRGLQDGSCYLPR